MHLCVVGMLCSASWLPVHGAIQPVAEGFLFTGGAHDVLIGATNGAVLSVRQQGEVVATGGAAGLWSLRFGPEEAGAVVQAASFAASSASNTFEATLSPSGEQLFLTYSNAEVSVTITLTDRADGVDMTAAVSPAATNVLELTLPAALRFAAADVDRFIAPNHSSDGVGMAFNASYFMAQDAVRPASWGPSTAGPDGYAHLYGGPLQFGEYVETNLLFTAEGVAWLGAAWSNTWSGANAIVHRPPATGQADVVLIDSPNGAYFSGSRLGGGAEAGYLLRIGGAVDAPRVALTLDTVVGAIEHLAGQPGGRTNVAMLSMVRGPMVGETWPSEVRLDQWRNRLTAAHGVGYTELTTVPELLGALADTNTLAILNPYGELIPVALGAGALTTVTNILPYVHGGGHWVEVGGHPFFQVLQPERYYTNSLPYPPAFADFMQLETTNGAASLYGVQPSPPTPWAGATNPAALFVPGRLAWGADAEGGWMQRGFGTYVAPGHTWTSPVVRLAVGRPVADALQDYAQANAYTRTLEDKMTAGQLDAFRQSVMIHLKGSATQMTARLDDLPAPAVLHFEEYLKGGFDKEYPDHLPPNPVFGTPAEFTNFLAEARARQMLTMPYTNPTFWGVDPKGPTFLATNDAPLLVNLDGTINYEEYFGHGGFTVTPWHPAVQAANRHTRDQFLSAYPVDILFHDQIGARTWQYDLNPESPTPYAYIAGVAAIAGEDSAYLPTSTENGWDRLINYNAQFAGLAWGLAPTPNAPFWRRFLSDRVEPSTWRVFPLAQHLAHDKLGFIYNNLDAAVADHAVMAWTLALGYGTTDVLLTEQLDNVARREWLMWIDRVQKSVIARYVGRGVVGFDHHRSDAPGEGVISAQYGDVEVLANMAPQPFVTNGWTLAANGYLASAPGMIAAHIIPAPDADPVAYVAEAESAERFDFWIHGDGGTNIVLHLPTGYNGTMLVHIDGLHSRYTEVVGDRMTLSLGEPGSEAVLWTGYAERPTSDRHGAVLVDFGNNESFRGASVVNPDSQENYWNSVWSGAVATNLVDHSNRVTSLSIGFTVAEGTDSFNGPDGAVDAASLGLLGGSTNAVNDYYVSSRFSIQGLDTGTVYRLTFFGSHKFSDDDATVYAIYNDAAYTGIQASVTLDVQVPGAPWLHNSNAVAVIDGLYPQADGHLYVGFEGSDGGFGYLNAMQVEAEESGLTYAQWAGQYTGLGGPTEDDDGNGLANLGEYALGGNPTNAADLGHVPVAALAANDLLHYTHVQRTDAADLAYHIEVSTNLLQEAWWVAEYTAYPGVPSADPSFVVVSNAVPLANDTLYLRLRISLTP